jgi:NADPH:quinone reductase-like Zn-dependent oxidoreductase
MTVSTSTIGSAESAVPPRMRAAVLDPTGAPRLADVALPQPVGAEVLVRIAAAGIGPLDAEADAAPDASDDESAVLGSDFSGTVVAAPYEGFWLQPGDEVFGVSGYPRSGGSFAQYAAVPAANLARKPKRLSHTEAAAVPTAALTAWGVVVDLVHAHEGQRVLIHAAAGGVGHLAVQLAGYFGAQVTATASGANVEWVRWLGADRVLDYHQARFEDEVHGADAVIDLVGDDALHTGPRSVGVLRPGGLLVTVPGPGWPTLHEDAERAGIRATRYRVTPDSTTLAVLARLLDAGDLRVSVAEVLPLDRIEDAQRLVASGHVRGRVVLQMG